MSDEVYQTPNSTDTSVTNPKAVLVPKGITIGLAIFAFILGIAGFLVKMLLFKQTLPEIMPAFVRMVAIFWLLIPCGVMLVARIINKFSGKPPIQARNALTFGLLLTCVAMLWLMAGNS